MCGKVYFVFFLLTTIINLSVCDYEISEPSSSMNALINSLFNVNLKLQNLDNNQNNGDENEYKENFILSPIGLSLTLAQVATSANNHWRNFINNFMNWNSLTDNLSITINNLLVNLTTPDQITRALRSYEETPAYINITSALFYERNLQSDINESTINILKNDYQSEVQTLEIQ